LIGVDNRREMPGAELVYFFTDVVDSTRLAQELGETGFARANDAYRAVVREVLAGTAGREVSTHGDAFFAVYDDPGRAVEAACELHARTAAGPLRTRIGLHHGSAASVDGTYLGVEVNRAARIADAAHGGQIVVSQSVRDLLPGGDLLDLGEHRLKGFLEPSRLYQWGSTSFPPLRTSRPSTLPLPGGALIGRREELESFRGLVGRGVRLVTVAGAGGVGKTRFALEAVWALPAEAHWADLSSTEDRAAADVALARSLGADSPAGARDALGDRPAVLLVDNAEHLPEVASTIADLVSSCPTLTVVVTSRARLGLREEHVLTLAPLPAGDAAALFTERARQLNPSFAAGDRELASVVAQLDRLPLALELAAARVSLLGLGTLSQRLAQNRFAADDRSGSLRSTIQWSYNLLSGEEQVAFARFALFAGGATLDAAELVTGASLDELQSLVDKSLLEVTHQHAAPRLTMLATIRSFAAERLVEDEGRDGAIGRFVQRFLTEAEKAAPHLVDGERQLELIRWYELELDNLRQAFGLAVERHDADHAARLVFATRWARALFDRRELLEWQRRALTLTGADAAQRARLLTGLSVGAALVGEHEEQTAAAAEALALAESLGDPGLLADALDASAFATADYGEALALLGRALDEIAKVGDANVETRLRINFGAVALNAGAFEDAARESERGLAQVRATGNRDGIATAGLNLAQALLELGDTARAVELGHEALELSEETGDAASQAIAHLVLAVATADPDELAAAESLLAAGDLRLEAPELKLLARARSL
jgi:class 3 adenylate cyclase/predicted ATPase